MVIIFHKPKFSIQLYDMLAAKEGEVFFIEIKSKETWYPPSQQDLQRIMAEDYGLNFVVIKQSKKHGKVNVVDVHIKGTMSRINKDLSELWE